MWPFSKKARYNIKGREIVIINNSKIKNIRFFYKPLRIACQTVEMAKKFPKITFSLETKPAVEGTMQEEGDAWVNSDEIEEGLVILHLYVIKKLSERELIEKLSFFVAHELTHIWHDYTSRILQKELQISRRTAIALKKNISDITDSEPDLKDIRYLLLNFIADIFIEGLADYCGDNLKEKFDGFSEYIFQRLYQIADKEGSEIKKTFEQYLISKQTKYSHTKIVQKMIKLSRVSAYSIGQHMVYSILFIDHDMTVEKVAKLSPHKFVKKYETIMKIKGKRPVVSLTSGDGILDYRRMVAQWWVIVKEHKKQWGNAHQ